MIEFTRGAHEKEFVRQLLISLPLLRRPSGDVVGELVSCEHVHHVKHSYCRYPRHVWPSRLPENVEFVPREEQPGEI